MSKFNFDKIPFRESIESALRDGCMLWAFRSGGGLRVVHLRVAALIGFPHRLPISTTPKKTRTLSGYGEHPNLEGALSHVGEDFAAGGRPYREVYGVIHPHRMHGSAHSSSELDQWVLGGNKIGARFLDGLFVVELQAPQPFCWTNGFHRRKSQPNEPLVFAGASDNLSDAFTKALFERTPLLTPGKTGITDHATATEDRYRRAGNG